MPLGPGGAADELREAGRAPCAGVLEPLLLGERAHPGAQGRHRVAGVAGESAAASATTTA